MAFRRAAAVSITYALMSRCGLEPEDYFEHEDFLSFFDFNTRDTLTALGMAVRSAIFSSCSASPFSPETP